MTPHFDIQAVEYSVCGLRGFKLSQAARFWRTKFETVQHFRRNVINHPGIEKLGAFMEEIWDDIELITVQEALQETNLEKRRVMFDCIGVARLFETLQPELLDRQVIQKSRTRWDESNMPYECTYSDTYELYRLHADKLFAAIDRGPRLASVYAVRCWCTTTKREYWIYVPEDIVIGSNGRRLTPDAIRAIAWTIRIDVSHPKRIYRQGDIILVEESVESETVPPYHLTKDQYLTLIFSET